MNRSVHKADFTRYILICALILPSLHSYSQVSYWIKGGMNVNDFRLRNAPPELAELYHATVGFHLGLFGQLNLTEEVSLHPGLQFTQRGVRTDDTYSGNRVRINLNYIELPVLISYYPKENFAIDFGPSFAYKISAVAKSDGSSNNIDDYYNKNFDFGISAGLRFHLSDNVLLIGNYYHGLIKIDELIFNSNSPNVPFYNRTFQIGAGYRLKN